MLLLVIASLLLELALWVSIVSASRTDHRAFGWRMPCGAFRNITRLDPIVSPNQASEHAHIFHGASRVHSAATYEDLRNSECTSCKVAEDKSAYWVPALYWQGADGQYTAVRTVGGILAYYWFFDDKVQAFPPGFRMLAGDGSRRISTISKVQLEKSFWTSADETQDILSQKALGFNCLNYAVAPEPTLHRHEMPDKAELQQCVDGVRVEIVFPSCWNGKDTDSSDHKSHMAYSNLVIDGSCPPDYPVRVPALMYEVIFATHDYTGKDGRFVLANGDETGLSNHGDFMNGWDEGFLQSAVNDCVNDSGEIGDCKQFTIQPGQPPACDAEDYKPIDPVMRESCEGPMAALCGSKKAGGIKAAQVVPAPLPKEKAPAPSAQPAPIPIPPPPSPPPPPSASVPELPAPIAPPIPPPGSPTIAEPPLPPPPPPPAPATSPAPTPPPRRVSTVVQIEEVTVYSDIYTTVWEKKKRHVHHHNHWN